MLAPVVVAALFAGAAQAQVVVRGSGTTNPKKVHWELMEQMESMAGTPLELSYRGIGSSGGLAEFKAGFSHFGCSEVPLTQDEKTTLCGSADCAYQMPLVIGAMSIFHSIPAAEIGTDGLQLTPCMLAKIFSRSITTWDDAELRTDGVNTVNSALASVNQPIIVNRRTSGSSTTNFVTKYIHESTRAGCPSDWTLGSGTTVAWPAGTTAVVGSGGMSAALAGTPYGIGYIDSGHGHDDGLSEVKLKNFAGTYLDSVTAGTAGVQAAVSAANASAVFPAADGNWTSVNLINQAGPSTWPIVAFSYLLALKDMDVAPFTTNTNLASATKAYLHLAMHAKGGQALAEKYNFKPLPAALATQNTAAVAAIAAPAGDTPFVFEWSTDTTNGNDANRLSTKRRSHLLAAVNKHEMELNLITGTSGSLTAVQAMTAGRQSSLPLEMHGSGTTNPSKLIWKMMATLRGMAMRPLHLSYRAIGSSSGIAEFLAGSSHFGSAEIPLTPAEVAVTGSTVLQIPLVLGAMSAFHSVPESDLGGAGLHLTPCVLAEIFSRQITMWNDAKILALNPSAFLPAQGIVMLHRNKGSSTTNFFTKYLSETTQADCPAAWTLGWGPALTTAADVTKYPNVTQTWEPDSAPSGTSGGVVTCQGSGNMASNLATIPYSIGYIDSGHGHDDGLSEIKLKNKAGNFIDSKEAGADGVKAAANSATKPATSAGDWSTVNLLNIQTMLPSPYFPDNVDKTWPIVAISYLFVKQDLSALGETGAAVKAFLEYTQSSESGYSSTKGGQKFAAGFNFVPIPSDYVTISTAGIAGITLKAGVTPFVWEWSTDTDIGSDRMTLSCKRSNYDTYGIDSNAKATVAATAATTASIASIENRLPSGGLSTCEKVFGASAVACEDVDDAMAIAWIALIISIINFLIFVFLAVRSCSSKPDSACAAKPHAPMTGV